MMFIVSVTGATVALIIGVSLLIGSVILVFGLLYLRRCVQSVKYSVISR